MRPRKWHWWALGGVIAVAAIGGIIFVRRGPKPTPVQMAKVARQDLQAKVTANGKVQAQKKVDISATIPGQVTHLAVKEGDRVTRGQFLLQIDPINPRALARSAQASVAALERQLESARASLAQADADRRRAEENWHARILSEADLQRARTAFETAQAEVAAAEQRVAQAGAQLEGARDQLTKTEVRAPMDGVVTAKRIEEGEVAVIGIQNSPGTVLLTISDMSVVETELEVDESSIPSVKPGQEARVRIDAYPNRTFEGAVTEVGSSPLLRTNTTDQSIKFKVKAQIKDPPADVKPGLSVQADILTGFRAHALAVPLQALVVKEIERSPGDPAPVGAPREEEGVYVVQKGKVLFKPLKTGLVGELAIEATEGLNGDETIVTGPFRVLRTLKPGDPVVEEKRPEHDEGAAGPERS
ncbi:MAG TPA: efflux RND transporter periplasmic adaptor subunit [Candidatus Polarisedimenticolia bacterium]|nr:efflux RND transporter periplasmic adaptor subunit [Candidatus Polarisedimenticolia bacterium]